LTAGVLLRGAIARIVAHSTATQARPMPGRDDGLLRLHSAKPIHFGDHAACALASAADCGHDYAGDPFRSRELEICDILIVSHCVSVRILAWQDDHSDATSSQRNCTVRAPKGITATVKTK
jgi:hypothetical protein